MTDDVEKCEDTVLSDQYHKKDWDCNSSSGGSIYQEIHGRPEETMYSTDDEFLDATETIRSPLLSDDPEEQLSAPVLKQLRQEKEQTRYIVVDMVTDSESVNNIMEHSKQNYENNVVPPSGHSDSEGGKKEPDCPQTLEERPNVGSVPTEQQITVEPKLEKSKFARTLRLPSSVALPTSKSDRPARGDGRPPIGISKIPLPMTSVTKLPQQSSTPEQNRSEPESCQKKYRRQPGHPRKSCIIPTVTLESDKETEDEAGAECLNEMNPPAPVSCHANGAPTPSTPVIPDKPPSRPSSKPLPSSPSSKPLPRPASKQSPRPPPSPPKEDITDNGNENNHSAKEGSIKEETSDPHLTPKVLTTSEYEESLSNEKPRTKRARSHNKNNEKEKDSFGPIATNPVNSVREGAEIKRMRVANKPISREDSEKRFGRTGELPKDPEKRKREIQAVRNRLAKDRLNLINSRDKNEESIKQSQSIIESNTEQKAQDSLKSENTQKPGSKKSDTNNTSQTINRMRASSSNVTSEKNTMMHNSPRITQSSSPRQLSPLIMNMTIVEKRRQWRKSREAANGDPKTSVKNSNMPEIKPLLFKSNQLKTNQIGQRHQENVTNLPMKTSLEDESLGRKSTLVEKRKLMMKQKEALNNKTNIDVQRSSKAFDRPNKETPPLHVSQKQSSSDIQKPPSGVPKSIEKTASSDTQKPPSSVPKSTEKTASSDIQKPPSVVPQSTEKTSSSDIQKPPSSVTKSTEKMACRSSNFVMPDLQPEVIMPDVQVKSLINTSKVTMASLQNVYKIHYKRCEDHLSEVKRAKEKLCMSLGKLDHLRNQMIEKCGENVDEVVPPLTAVPVFVQDAPTIITTTKGMNTEVLEDVAEKLVLLGNNQQLKHEIENLRMQLEEAKELGYSNKKEDDVILDLRQRIREMSLTLTLAEKRQQTLEDNMEEKQKEILSLTNENKQMFELFKQRDQQLSALRKQIEEKNRDLDSFQKKVAEANNTLQEEIYKREVSHIEHQKLMEEKCCIEKELQKVDSKFADFEERELCLSTILENEKKKTKKLEELLKNKEDELNKMEKKFFEVESSSSSNIAVLTDQLAAKDTIIRELEILRTASQAQMRELCCLLSDIFVLRGIDYNVDHIQSAISSGSTALLREELLKIVEERMDENNKALNESRSKIAELQNQVKILQIELEDSKMMSDRLTNVITHQKPWDAEKQWDEHQRPWSSDMTSQRHAAHNNVVENPIRDKGFRDGEMHSIMPSMANSFVCSEAAMARNNFKELFVLLETKRRQLVQLERKYQDMEEVHSHCAQKRTRNETRIAQLEMMLATYQE